MKRWIHASASPGLTHDQHIEAFNNKYSKSVKDRQVDKNGAVYFQSNQQVQHYLDSYNKANPSAHLMLQADWQNDEDGYSFVYYEVV